MLTWLLRKNKGQLQKIKLISQTLIYCVRIHNSNYYLNQPLRLWLPESNSSKNSKPFPKNLSVKPWTTSASSKVAIAHSAKRLQNRARTSAQIGGTISTTSPLTFSAITRNPTRPTERTSSHDISARSQYMYLHHQTETPFRMATFSSSQHGGYRQVQQN